MFGSYAFCYCGNMVSAYVPYVYGFGSYGFRFCSKLSLIQMHSNTYRGYTVLYRTGT